MGEKRIQFNATDEVKEFVNTAANCDFDINMHYERAIVDGKSFLGALSLGLSKIVTVRYGGKNQDFEVLLRKYAVT